MKKRSKKILTFFLCASMVVSMAACGNENNTEQPTEDTSSATGNVSSDHLQAAYQVSADADKLDKSSDISDTLYGLFFEDINFAVDAGVYAELIKNRSFEYGSMAANQNLHGWVNSNKNVLTFSVSDGTSDKSYLNENNPHYAVLTNSSDSYEGIGNVGYLDGIAITKDANYILSLYTRGNNGYTGPVRVALEGKDGTVYAEGSISSVTDEWWKYEVTLTASATVNKDLRLMVELQKGSVDVDMVSLMPEDTYAGLPIRKDIGEAIEALNPSFIRFPGGCVIEGRDEESMYCWKDSIGNGIKFVINGETTTGDVAVRPQGKDIWSGNSNNPYYTTYGIGFYEYFLLCDTLDALPVPVLNAGMTCEIQSQNYLVYALSSEEFAQCIQDALDLVEFCRGDETTYWGSVRIAMGHKAPFELKYVAIGNEQWQTEYHAHYERFVWAFEEAAEKNPEIYEGIELIVANGTVSDSTEGWQYIKKNPDDLTTLVDEHYYQTADWFFSNTTRYDSYDRNLQADVFLGEYAAKANTLNAALAEAAYMTGIERNADLIKMACYAPMFGNSTLNQWTPDMMFFSNNELLKTINYYVQHVYANNVGTTLLASSLEVDESQSLTSLKGKVGLGSWMTSVSYDNIKVVSNDDGSVLYESDFSSDSTLKDDKWINLEGDWEVSDGALLQYNTANPASQNTGDVVYVGDKDWTNYTLTVDAKILSGAEGFLIPICVDDEDNNIFWNIGGWGNTVSCLQIVEGGAKSDQVSGTVKDITLKKNTVYELKVEVQGNNIKCYVDDKLYVNYTKTAAAPLFETASLDENGDIILKLVNTSEYTTDIKITLDAFDMSQYDTTAVVTTLAGETLGDTNSFENPELVAPKESTTEVGESFTYEAPKYSVTIIRIPHK